MRERRRARGTAAGGDADRAAADAAAIRAMGNRELYEAYRGALGYEGEIQPWDAHSRRHVEAPRAEFEGRLSDWLGRS